MTSHLKTIEQQYVVLDEIQHVRHRISMYAGSPILAEENLYVFDKSSWKMQKKTLNKIPALIKVVSEAIDNVVDEHKRNPNKINKLTVSIDKKTNEISIEDNGGIPVELHKEFGKYVPEIIFGMLRSGSNYNDSEDQALVGTNGLGVKLLNICSEYFIIETADGKNSFTQEFKSGMRDRSEPVIKSSNKNFTRLTFKIDLEYFKLQNLDDAHIQLIQKRAIDAAGNNPQLKVYLSDFDKPFQFKNIDEYFNLYSDTIILDSNADWKIGVGPAVDGFEQVSFVNSVETYEGGTHVNYVMDQIVGKVREFVKKKHKVEVKPGDVRNQLNIFISANINRPKFNSQNKTHLISEPKDFKTSWIPSEKFINKLLKSEVIERLMDWVKAKELAAQNAELRKLNKETDKQSVRKITKLSDAGLAGKEPEKCILFLTEGLSASLAGKSTRDPQTMGFYALKGKPLNVNSAEVSKLVANEEFKNIMTAMGLSIGTKVNSLKDLRYGGLAFMTDADVDGGHISGLLINMIHKFWPELFQLGVVYRFITPLIKVTINPKNVICFDQEWEFTEWKEKNPDTKFKMKYYKGLATSVNEEFKEYFKNIENHLVRLTYVNQDDSDDINLVFGKEAGMTDKRKTWLDIE